MSDKPEAKASGGDAWDATQWHEVVKGDTLWKIAEHYYGDGNLYPKIDILSQSKKLPATLTKEKFDAAKAGLAEATKGWEEASAAFKNGALADALVKGEAVKAKTVEALEALGMPVPPAAKS